ncbi:MAG TPA: transglycosylase domain-containing protein [Actinomycetota bacterium]|nr:transglycosylase domain-containing protein [Actinomycetota bacterium]
MSVLIVISLVVTSSPYVALQSLTLLPELPEAPPPLQTSRLVDRHGRTIALFHGAENRRVVSAKRMPDHLRDATVAIEDASFYEHNGVNFGAVARAALANVNAGKVEQGGSTITQQYVRNVYKDIGTKRTIVRKVKEVLASLEFERRNRKRDILTKYLNTVYFGRGAYGVEAAARSYFGKHSNRLTLSESAFLAGAIHSPQRYARDRKAGIARRNLVLDRMVANDLLTAKEAAQAKREPLRTIKPGSQPVRAAYFVEYVRRLLIRPKDKGGFGFTDKQLLTGGYTIRTTLDLRMQRAAEKAVASVLNRRDDPETALVAMSTRGEVRAMVGGRDFTNLRRARGFNFAWQAARGGGRQPGSAFKPFTLAAWVDRGRSARARFNAPSRITVDKCRNGDGSSWDPSNYEDQGFGSMSVVEATEKSVNTVYAQMVARIGPQRVVALAKAAGITSKLDPVCSIALGTMGVTPLELARAYATFAARGARPNVIAVRQVVGPDGDVVAERAPRLRRTIKARTADKVNKILERVIQRGTGTPAAIGRPAAGKTGTTDNRRDVWFAGHTPHPGLSAAVWIGYPPNSKGKIRNMTNLHGVRATGGRFAGVIWARFMREALKDTPRNAFRAVDLGTEQWGGDSRSRRSSGGASGGRRYSRDRDDDDGTTRERRGKGRKKR